VGVLIRPVATTDGFRVCTDDVHSRHSSTSRCRRVGVSRNTAPRTPRAPRWNIFKTSRRWCSGFNWISSKITRKRWISEEGELTKGRNVQLPAVHVYSQCSARSVRGAVFRDIDSSRRRLVLILSRPDESVWFWYYQNQTNWYLILSVLLIFVAKIDAVQYCSNVKCVV